MINLVIDNRINKSFCPNDKKVRYRQAFYRPDEFVKSPKTTHISFSGWFWKKGLDKLKKEIKGKSETEINQAVNQYFFNLADRKKLKELYRLCQDEELFQRTKSAFPNVVRCIIPDNEQNDKGNGLVLLAQKGDDELNAELTNILERIRDDKNRNRCFEALFENSGTQTKRKLAQELNLLSADVRKDWFYKLVEVSDTETRCGLAFQISELKGEDRPDAFNSLLKFHSRKINLSLFKKLTYLPQKMMIDNFLGFLEDSDDEQQEALAPVIVCIEDVSKMHECLIKFLKKREGTRTNLVLFYPPESVENRLAKWILNLSSRVRRDRLMDALRKDQENANLLASFLHTYDSHEWKANHR